MTLVDAASAPRPDEELPAGVLGALLAERIPGLVPPLTIGQFPAGHSNLTYLLTDSAHHEYVLRRPPLGALVKSANDMAREHRVLVGLHPVFPHAPRLLAFVGADDSPLGASFYVIERIRGIVLRSELPLGLPHTPEYARALSEVLVDELAEIHAVDVDAAGLADLGRPVGYVERQVHGWTRRYRDAQTDDVPDIDAVADWLAAHLPGEADHTLVHNDFRHDNLALDPDTAEPRVVAVFDWEMATIGCPLLDLGVTLAYYVQADDPPGMHEFRPAPTHLPGSLTRREVAERYTERTGRATSGIAFHTSFGLFRNAVVLQQLYARFARGLTQDERLGRMAGPVRAMAAQARRVAETGAI